MIDKLLTLIEIDCFYLKRPIYYYVCDFNHMGKLTMLIDRIDKKILKSLVPDDAGEIFYIDESAADFSKEAMKNSKERMMNDIYLPQPLPFNKFIIHFLDFFVVVTSGPTDDDALGVNFDSFGVQKDGSIGCLHGDMFCSVLCCFDNIDLMFSKIGMIDKKKGIIKILTADEQEKVVFGAGISLFCYSWIIERFLSFLSCKNVLLEKVVPHKKIQRKRAKKGKSPLFSYHVLKLKNVSYKSGKNGEAGLWSNRVHLCRGHVREYTAENPLFGKIVGKFWIPPHARGNRDLGVVQKDYALGTRG